jgi:hypothetical protein
MQFFRNHAKPVIGYLCVCLLGLSAYTPAAHAGIVGTEALLNAAATREEISAFLARDDVQQQLIKYGVDPAEAQARANNLTNQEAQALAERIDSSPAGGDVLGSLVFVFLVLLVTDLLGLTDIFPFVKKTR